MKTYDSFCCFRSAKDGKARVLWELNTACNLSCSFCHAAPNLDRGLDTEYILRGLDFLQAMGVGDVIFSGGEPLLRKDIFEILSYSLELGLQPDLCTNGVLVNSEIAARLARYLNEVSVSLDAGTPERHDELRGQPGAWGRTVCAIEHLIEAGIDVHCISLVTDETYLFLEETAQFLEKLGAESLTFLGLMPFPDSDDSHHRLSNETREQVLAALPRIRTACTRLRINTKCVDLSKLCGGCGAGVNIFGIDAKGKMSPCILLKDAASQLNICSLGEPASWAEKLRDFDWHGRAYHMAGYEGPCIAYLT